MGIFKFSMRMLVKDYKKSLFYGITLIFAVAVCFVFFNIINNPDLADQAVARSGGTWSDVQMPFSSVLSFLIICFCFTLYLGCGILLILIYFTALS